MTMPRPKPQWMPITEPEPERREPYLLQLAANLTALEDARDWAGVDQMWCCYGYRACLDALAAARLSPELLPEPTVSPMPCSMDNWDLFEGQLQGELRDSLEVLDDPEADEDDRRRARADAADLRFGINLIRQRCNLIEPAGSERSLQAA